MDALGATEANKTLRKGFYRTKIMLEASTNYLLSQVGMNLDLVNRRANAVTENNATDEEGLP